jgi:hypothetical protein
MYKWISFFFQKNKLNKKIEKKYNEAIQFQRMGKIREYSQSMNEIANLEDEYERLQNSEH